MNGVINLNSDIAGLAVAGSRIFRSYDGGEGYGPWPIAAQIVTFAGTATGGTFTLKCLHYTGVEVTTAALAYNAATATILAAVNAVLGTSAVAIAAADTMPNDALTFTFSGANYAGKPQRLILPDIALMTGGTPTVTVVETADIHWRMY